MEGEIIPRGLGGLDAALAMSLADRERVISQGLATYIEVGLALLATRTDKAYRQHGFDTFEDYCEAWLEIGRQRGYALCATAELAARLSQISDTGTVLPRRESHARALLPLKDDPERLAAAWQDAVATATNGTRLTAAHVGEVVLRHLPKPPPPFYTLAIWREMDAEQRAEALALPRDRRHTFNDQDNDNIEWSRFSWNPVTGCLHNCSFCYARDIAERFYEQKFVPAFLPSRLDGPRNTRVPPQAAKDVGYRNVFVGSMADLFGRWVPSDWIEAVLAEVRANPQWSFLFLTKFPNRLREFSPFPDNAWMGTSVDAQARVRVAEEAFADVEAAVKWLSCEPLLEPLRFEHLKRFNWIVMGGASRSSQTPEWRPPRSWVDDLRGQARRAGCKVYEKTNLLERLREYPGVAVAKRVSIPDAFRMPYLQRDILEPDAYAEEMLSGQRELLPI